MKLRLSNLPRILVIVVLLGCVVMPKSGLGQAPTAASCGGELQILSINGIFTTPENAALNAQRIQALLQFDPNLGSQPFTVQVVYNPFDPYGQDLVEVFNQKIDEGLPLLWSDFIDWLQGTLENSVVNDALKQYLAVDGAQRLRDLKNTLNSAVAYSDPTVVKIETLFQSKLASSSKILVVSHSQGNLYANAAYAALAASPNSTGLNLNAIGFAQVADPAAAVATGDGYVTSKTDLVIAGLFGLSLTNTLIWNDNSVPLFPAGDFIGHNLRAIYTAPEYPVIRQHVINTIDATLARLSSVNTGLTSGPITTTLIWDIAGDVDLHTYEPSGAHVFYANRYGSVGFLDRDDTQGTGPEHYYTNTNAFVAGTYQFGVNYYAGNSGGNGPRTATVHVCALGVDYPSRSTVLTTPEGVEAITLQQSYLT